MSKVKLIWKKLSIRDKLLVAFTLTSAGMFFFNLFIYGQVNQSVGKINQVFTSNINLNSLEDTFTEIQGSMYTYLSVKSSDALNNYYRTEQDFREKLQQLNTEIMDDQVMLLEKNIRSMSESYLEVSEEAVQAKRGQNVTKYKMAYAEAEELYNYINQFIYQLNNLYFQNNALTYQTLLNSLRYMEIASIMVLIIITILNVVILTMITKSITTPLSKLAESAAQVGKGDFSVRLPHTESGDEVGIMADAFKKMVHSLEDYTRQIRENMEKEQEMIERELTMKALLKESQLKYLQAQINPHFLFNSLNIGAQLALLEDAEQTGFYIERLAELFRYNLKKGSGEATVREEIEMVDTYIYILNVRFDGEIHFMKSVDESLYEQVIPTMLLQPVVENAVNHGIRNVEWEGEIALTVRQEGEYVYISVKDNGAGMSREKIRQVLQGGREENQTLSSSNGIAISNVIHRLELYYNRKNLLQIFSEGEGMGTEVLLKLPVPSKEEVQ